MTDGIWLRTRPGEVEAAMVADGLLVDYALWRPGAPDGFGDLHRGRVTARTASLGGVFVRLEGEQDGFLPDREVDAVAGVGTLLAVRIVRASQAGKGPKLTARLLPEEVLAAGSGDARLVRRGASPVRTLLDAQPDAPVFVSGRLAMAALSAETGARALVIAAADRDVFPVEEEVAALRDPVVALAGGARASLTPTPALVAIDVDTAGGNDERAGKQAAQLASNRALLPALLRQVRLRNLSGAIVVDLAGLAARKRALLAPDFVAALAADPLRPRFLGFTALGLAEIVRVRTRPALHELQSGGYAAALDAAAALALAQGQAPHRGLAVAAAPGLAALLQRDDAIRADLVRGSGRPFIVRSDPSLEAGRWKLVEIGS